MPDTRPLIDAAVHLAAELQQEAVRRQTASERRQQAELDRMIKNPADKVTLVELTDQAFRSRAAARAADQLIHILDVQGIPRFFSPLDRPLLHGFQTFGGWLPGGGAAGQVAAAPRDGQRRPARRARDAPRAPRRPSRRRRADESSTSWARRCWRGGGRAAAAGGTSRRSQWPEIEVVSVKISTIDSQISPLAREHTIARLCDRLELLYRAAAAATLHPAPTAAWCRSSSTSTWRSTATLR